jgi:hypothetical protein
MRTLYIAFCLDFARASLVSQQAATLTQTVCEGIPVTLIEDASDTDMLEAHVGTPNIIESVCFHACRNFAYLSPSNRSCMMTSVGIWLHVLRSISLR